MERGNVGPSELAKGSGVSLDVIKKLRLGERPNSSTTPENALKIAAYFGLTLEAFMKTGETEPGSALADLAQLLTPQEEKLLAAQIRGLLAARGQQ